MSTSSSHERSMFFVVDRKEGGVVVLVDETEKATDVDAAMLPADCRSEGAVLRVPLDSASQPAWGLATRDRAEERRRLEANADRLAKLRHGDPGGNVSL